MNISTNNVITNPINISLIDSDVYSEVYDDYYGNFGNFVRGKSEKSPSANFFYCKNRQNINSVVIKLNSNIINNIFTIKRNVRI